MDDRPDTPPVPGHTAAAAAASASGAHAGTGNGSGRSLRRTVEADLAALAPFIDYLCAALDLEF